MEIGQILKPQGVRGELKVKPLTDDPQRFKQLKSVYVDERLMRVVGVRISPDSVYLRLSGVDDRNAAELLRGKFLHIDRAAAVKLDENEFFISDLVGAELYSREGSGVTKIGKIVNVQSFGAADVIEAVCNENGEKESGKGMTFAFVKSLKPEYDADNNKLTVDGAALAEVAVYED